MRLFEHRVVFVLIGRVFLRNIISEDISPCTKRIIESFFLSIRELLDESSHVGGGFLEFEGFDSLVDIGMDVACGIVVVELTTDEGIVATGERGGSIRRSTECSSALHGLL